MENELEMLNPQIREVIVGTKTLRKIKIYPLSIHDQTEVTGIIKTSIAELFSLKDADNIKILSFVQEVLQNNLDKLIGYITEEGPAVLKEISNDQALEIAQIVYEVNYDSLQKKTKKILEKMKGKLKLFQPEILSQPSSETIPSTDLKTSLEKATEKEVLQ